MSWQQRNKALKAEMLAGIEPGQFSSMTPEEAQALRDYWHKGQSVAALDRLRRGHQDLLKNIGKIPWNMSNSLARARQKLTYYERLQYAGVFSPQGRGTNPVTGGVIPYRTPNLFERTLTGFVEGTISSVNPFGSMEGGAGLGGVLLGGGFPFIGGATGAWRNRNVHTTEEGIPYTRGGHHRPRNWSPVTREGVEWQRIPGVIGPFIPHILEGGDGGSGSGSSGGGGGTPGPPGGGGPGFGGPGGISSIEGDPGYPGGDPNGYETGPQVAAMTVSLPTSHPSSPGEPPVSGPCPPGIQSTAIQVIACNPNGGAPPPTVVGCNPFGVTPPEPTLVSCTFGGPTVLASAGGSYSSGNIGNDTIGEPPMQELMDSAVTDPYGGSDYEAMYG